MTDRPRLRIAKTHTRSNCVGSALFLTECIDFDVNIEPYPFGRNISDYLEIGSPETGNLVVIYENNTLRHFAVITKEYPITVVHRMCGNGPIMENDSLSRITEYYSKDFTPKNKYYKPARIELEQRLYNRFSRWWFEANYSHFLKK